MNPMGMYHLLGILDKLSPELAKPILLKWATKKKKTYCPWSPSCLIGLLISWFSPHRTGEFFIPYTINNQGPLFHCSNGTKNPSHTSRELSDPLLEVSICRSTEAWFSSEKMPRIFEKFTKSHILISVILFELVVEITHLENMLVRLDHFAR